MIRFVADLAGVVLTLGTLDLVVKAVRRPRA